MPKKAEQLQISQPEAEEETVEEEKETETAEEDFSPYKNEIILITTVVVSLISLFSIIGIGGIAGSWFRSFLFGTMGIMGYLFPFVLFFVSMFMISNSQNKKVMYRLFCCIGIYIVLMGIFQILFYSKEALTLGGAYLMSAQTTLGGGFLGALLSKPLSAALGIAGAYVVLAALLLILFTFVSSRFLFSSLGQKGKKQIKQMHQQYQAQRIERNVIKESYKELPPRKRRRAVTFDLQTDFLPRELQEQREKEFVIVSKSPVEHLYGNTMEISPQEPEKQKHKTQDLKKNKKQNVSERELSLPTSVFGREKSLEYQSDLERKTGVEYQSELEQKKDAEYQLDLENQNKTESGKSQKRKKAIEMSEYEPEAEQGAPLTQGSDEIRREMEHGFFESMSGDYCPQIRFVDKEDHKDFVRRIFSERTSGADGQEVKIQSTPEKIVQEALKDSMQDIQKAVQEKAEPEPLSEIISETMHVEQMPAADKDIDEYGTETKQAEEAFVDPQEAFLSGGFERFKKEKKFDGSVLEGTQDEEELHPVLSSSYTAAGYVFPPINLLAEPSNIHSGMSQEEIQKTADRLLQTFESFKVRVRFGNVSCGPAVTRYEVQPEQGVKVSKITNLADDIKLNLAAADIRIEAPIPGKAAIGIEVPNRETTPVLLRELLENDAFQNHKSKIAFAVGKDIAGQPMVTDIAKMPHLLIAGATGSGKSVCINTLIMSILYKANPDDVKLIMIDPKVVELSVYNGIPHLLIPVVTDPKKASAALNWAVLEMTDRYEKFAQLGVREIGGYNRKVEEAAAAAGGKIPENHPKLPQIIIIVDELADLMMVAPGDVEEAICRIAQLARAAGIHLVIATQRPSVNVITGVIKANIPSRIAFSVSSAVDSRTIIDGVGAEKLLGKGDMLFFPTGFPKPVRVQGAFVSDSEVTRVVEYLREQNISHTYDAEVSNKIAAAAAPGGVSGGENQERDEYFAEAGKFIIEKEKASIGMLQRVYKIGFNRAARIMDQLSEAGVVGPEEGTKPRKILMTKEEFEQYLG